ncbi:MAG TPA: hypothetical protein VL284_17030 [Thermoanaerobaculia bacterium]|nr:hypothetical protein [Thermoanaerobaculia bacterium]
MAGDSTRGTGVAGAVRVARRITAVFGMLAIVALLGILVWRVYLHHQHGVGEDEPAVVRVARPLLYQQV